MARSQVHCPAGRAWQEHRGPATLFSVLAFSQLQSSADRLPQEHVDFDAQRHPSVLLLQQEAGLTVSTMMTELRYFIVLLVDC